MIGARGGEPHLHTLDALRPDQLPDHPTDQCADHRHGDDGLPQAGERPHHAGAHRRLGAAGGQLGPVDVARCVGERGVGDVDAGRPSARVNEASASSTALEPRQHGEPGVTGSPAGRAAGGSAATSRSTVVACGGSTGGSSTPASSTNSGSLPHLQPVSRPPSSGAYV